MSRRFDRTLDRAHEDAKARVLDGDLDDLINDLRDAARMIEVAERSPEGLTRADGCLVHAVALALHTRLIVLGRGGRE